MTTYYVDNSSANASDSNPGTSPDAPFFSLAAVNRLDLQPGDTVAIRAGTVYATPTALTPNSQVTVSYTPGAAGVASLLGADGSAVSPISMQATVAPTIDTTAPSITSVTIPPGSYKIGDVVTATISVASDPESYNSLSGRIDGYSLVNVVKLDNSTYTAQFTIKQYGTDIAAGTSTPVSLVLTDAAGNVSAPYTTPIPAAGSAPSGGTPVLLSVTAEANYLALNFDRPLNTSNIPNLADFRVMSNGQEYSVASVSFDQSQTTLDLSLASAAIEVSAPGSATAPITFTSYGVGANPIIDNTSSGYTDGMLLRNSSYVNVNNLEFAEAGQAGVDVANTSSNITISNTEETNVGEGVLLNGVNNLVTDNYIHDLHMVKDTPTSVNANDDYGANGVVIGGSDNEVSFNHILDAIAPSYDYGVDGGAVELVGPVSNTYIHDNWSESSDGFIEVGGYQTNVTNTSIVNNVSLNDGDFATIHNSAGYAVAFSNFDMAYNTIINTNSAPKGPQIVYLDAVATPDQVNFRDNIVSLNDGDSVFKREGSYHSNNIFYLYAKDTHLYNDWNMTLNAGESFGPLSYASVPGSQLPSVLKSATPTLGSALTSIAQLSSNSSGTVSSTTPSILSVSVPAGSWKIGDTFTVTITVAASSDTYSLVAGAVAGFTMSGLTKVNDTTYTANVLVGETGTDASSSAPWAVRLILSDSAGEQNPLFTSTINHPSGSIDAHRPVFSSASVNGAQLVLQYNEPLDSADPPLASAFIVKIGGSVVGVSGLTVNQTSGQVALTLAQSATPGAVVTVAYTDPTSGDDLAAIQDVAGNDAVSLTARLVTNTTAVPGAATAQVVQIDANRPTYISGAVNGSTLALTYSEALDSANLPPLSALSVIVDGVNVGVVGVNVSGSMLTLTLAAPVLEGSGVVFTYTDPTSGDDLSAIQDIAGNDAATVQRAITNLTLPVVYSVTLPNAPLKVNDVGTVTITVAPNESQLTSVSGTVDGFALSNLQLISSTQYTAQFTVAAGGQDQAATNDLPVSLILSDSAGNKSAPYTTPISQNGDGIDANPPQLAITSDDLLLTVGQVATITFAFSEAVAGFSLADVTAANGTLSDLATNDEITYTALYTPAAGFQGLDTIAVAAGSYTDWAGNPGSGAQTSETIRTAPPTLTITANPLFLMAAGASTLTFAFSEAVAGFSLADVSAAQGTLSNLATSDGITYTALYTPNSGFQGADVITVVAGSYTDVDGNPGAAAQAAVVTDLTPPTVVVSTNNPLLTVGETANLTFAFSEAVAGFSPADITAADGTLSNLATDDGITYTAVYLPAAGFMGSDTIAVAAGSYTDLAGNLGSGAQTSETIDTAPPTLTMTATGPFLSIGKTSTLTFTFSKPVVDFSLANVIAPHGTVSNLVTGDGITFTALYTPDMNYMGPDVITVPARTYSDLDGNLGGAGQTKVLIDTQAPTLAVTTGNSLLTVGETTNVTFAFSEAVQGFTLADVTTMDGTLSNLTTDDQITYTALYTPAAGFQGSDTIAVADGTYADYAGNKGSGAQISETIDTEPPTLTVTAGNSLLTVGKTTNVTFAFSEAVTGFSLASVSAGHGTLSNLTTSDGITYTAVYTPQANYSGADTIVVAAGSYADLSGNLGGLGQIGLSVDTTPPSLVISSSNGSLTAGKTATITFAFSEAVAGFSLANVSASHGTLSNLTTNDGITYTALYTPAASFTGSDTIAVAAGSYTDLSGNLGSGAQVGETIDTTPPTLAVTTGNSFLYLGQTANVTFAFSEAVAGFSLASVSAAHGTLSNLATSNGLTYSALYTPSSGFVGDDAITVASGSYTDLAGNAGASAQVSEAINTLAGFGGQTFNGTSGNDVVKGGAGDDILYGYAGNDQIGGGGGVDLMIGGTGDDTYNVNNANDVIVENPGEGTDSVNATVNYTLPANVEILQLSGTAAINGTGNALANTINGNDAANVLMGLAGDDTLRGNGGDDVLNGGAGNDYLSGGAGNDTLIGGPGTDTMYGGAGADTFVFQSLSDFGPATAMDLIGDFSTSDGDKIDLSAVDANSLKPGVQPFNWLGTGAFTGTPGDLHYAKSGGSLVVSGDTNGDKIADFQFTVAGQTSLSRTDFIFAATTTPPTLAISVNSPLLTIGQTATVTFAFSEAVTGVSLANVSAAHGTLSNLTTSDGVTYTALYTPVAGFIGSDTIAVAAGSYKDLSGNLGGAAQANLNIDTLAPTLSMSTSKALLTVGATASVTFAFSKAVAGFSLASVSAAHGILSNLSTSDGVTYTALYTPVAGFTGSDTIAVAAGSYTDLDGNKGAGGQISETIDTTPPTLAVTTNAPFLTSGATASVTFAFSEAVTGFSLANVSVAHGALTNLTTSDGMTYTALYTPQSNYAGSDSIVVAGGSYADLDGNAGASAQLALSINTVAADTTPPVLNISTGNGSLTAGKTATITFAFSEAVAGFSLANVSASHGTLSNLTTSDGITYTALYTPAASFTGSDTIAVAAGSYTDLSGNLGSGAQVGETIDTTPPTLAVTTGNSFLYLGQTANVTFAFSEAVAGFSLASVSAAHGTLSSLATSNGLTYSALYTPSSGFVGDDAITVASGSYTDLAGNAGASAQVSEAINTLAGFGGQTFNGTSGNDVVKGGAGDDILYGYAGNDQIGGGGGVDLMIGGTGDDTYNVNNANDVIVENPGEGTDSVNATVSYTLPANVEILQLSGTAATNGTGNALANTINGNDAANVLMGLAGDDTLRGNGGDDLLNGGAGNDYLSGGAGNDTLIGGPGTDTMYGGAGADTFVFQSLSDFGPATAMDLIGDFSTSDGDKIDLSALDNSLPPGVHSFNWLGTGAFTGTPGDLHYAKSNGSLVVSGDTNGDKIADFQFTVAGQTSLSRTDFTF